MQSGNSGFTSLEVCENKAEKLKQILVSLKMENLEISIKYFLFEEEIVSHEAEF